VPVILLDVVSGTRLLDHRPKTEDAYPDDELIQLSRAGADVEAYCINCDEIRSISTDERAELVSALNR
jgi:hypothetical protein